MPQPLCHKSVLLLPLVETILPSIVKFSPFAETILLVVSFLYFVTIDVAIPYYVEPIKEHRPFKRTPFIRVNAPFTTFITSFSILIEQLIESSIPREVKFLLNSRTYRTFCSTLSQPSNIRTLIDPIPHILLALLLPSKTIPPSISLNV